MWSLIFLRYLHIVCIILVAMAIFAELLLCKKQVARKTIKQLATVDNIYGIASVGFVAAGLILWLGGISKTPEYYSNNWIFLLKLGLAILLGLLSIYPTIFFFRNKKGEANDAVDIPFLVRLLIRIELVLIFSIPLLASMMANGVGILK